MKKQLFLTLMIILCCSSCITMQKKEQQYEYGSAFSINALHIQLLEECFPKDKNKIIRILRNEKILLTSNTSYYDYSKYDVVIYQNEFSYVFKSIYEIEIIKNKIVSCKQKECLFLDEQEIN